MTISLHIKRNSLSVGDNKGSHLNLTGVTNRALHVGRLLISQNRKKQVFRGSMILGLHDDVIKWKHFRVTGPLGWEFPSHRWIHKGQWCGPLMFSLICAWTNSWSNSQDAGGFRRHRAHYDVNADQNPGIHFTKHCTVTIPWAQMC